MHGRRARAAVPGLSRRPARRSGAPRELAGLRQRRGRGALLTPESSNGIAALELLEAEKDVLLLFTDVGLPGGLNGRQLADHQGRLDPGAELIGKPFTYATLVAKIQRLLRRAA